jgi:Fe-S-cluster containining protein
MKLSKTAFWDIDMQKLDFEKHKDYIIRKVFDFGLPEDLAEVMSFYPKETIINSLVTARYLDKKTLAFACSHYELKPEAFRCYPYNQSGYGPPHSSLTDK